MRITDDTIAKSIAPKHRPPSVTVAIDNIRKQGSLAAVTDLDLSRNTICLVGATQILEFVNKELPTLESLDLSGNQISDWRETDDNEAFETQLKLLLSRSTFQRLDLRSNPIAHLAWVQYITGKLGHNASKIVWENN